MSEDIPNMVVEDLAKPLHVQQLERALDVTPFLSYVQHVINTPITDEDSSGSDSEFQFSAAGSSHIENGIKTTREERRLDKMRLHNLDKVKEDRFWLRDILVSDTSESSENDSEVSEQEIQDMLRLHMLRKKYESSYSKHKENQQYKYYSVGLLSNYDKFPEHQRSIIGSKKKRKEKKLEKKLKKIKKMSPKEKKEVTQEPEVEDYDFDDSLNIKEEEEDESYVDTPSSQNKGMKSKRKSQSKNPEIMTMRRKKIWVMMSKKELGKIQRAKLNNHKEVLTGCKRVAQYCMKYWRQKAMQVKKSLVKSQKNMKETVWRAKRLTREMQAYWKRYDRVERETRRRQEKEAEEQRKLDGELMEAKRQQRKLNFLITQTELYAHFMSRKMGGANHHEQLRILSQLDEEKNPRLLAIDDYDSEIMKEKAKRNVQDALNAEQSRTRQFSHLAVPSMLTELAEDFKLTETSVSADEERPQPKIFRGMLKHYQLKGMNWLANLYDQGINGILADEMGLGKTVQSIAFLCHIAEKYNVWGPFLIISPASTLHNWQQEMARFVPDFKVVPYWGNPQERKILRQFWNQKGLHTRGASFHVVITSYQLVITDFKYFNRIKWQYLVLDEAQALKSTTSVRWKLLLGFSCRNRLLLSGTPIQNSMAELWALLHFIMPTLFDSHDEFNEWFSKDIESHAENKTGIDEKHLSRLHMILKPFMLRRIKKDVENELSDKIEVMVYCPLTTRQKLLYSALKKKIRIEDLLYSYTGAHQTSQSVTSSLMNLVMQFRKVCNHPELFERHEAKSPYFVQCQDYVIPKLIFEEGILQFSLPSQKHLLHNMFSIYTADNVYRSLISTGQLSGTSSFSFVRLCDLSPAELHKIALGGLLKLLLNTLERSKRIDVLHHRGVWWWWRQCLHSLLVLSCFLPLSHCNVNSSAVLKPLVFTSIAGSTVYTHGSYMLHSMAETLDHYILRSRKYVKMSKASRNIDVVSVKEEPDNFLLTVEADMRCLSPALKTPPLSGRGSPVSPIKVKSELPSSPKVIEDECLNECPVLPEFPHIPRPPQIFECQPIEMPSFLYYTCPKVQTRGRELYCSSSNAALFVVRHKQCYNTAGLQTIWYGSPDQANSHECRRELFYPPSVGGIEATRSKFGWSNIIVPDKQTLVTDAGKLYVLDGLLKRLKEQGHRVLIYSQMTRMIDLLEEYMWHRKHTYMRLDGSSKISERRDMVADFQSREDIFVFLLSTRAGGLGINLTAADTVIFYDSDWNPTVDQQAMDRAHRLGQTKQVTVYRLICKGTIEERILQRAREKSEIQRMVISGGNFKPDTLKPFEVVSLLLDDEEIERKYRQKQAEKRTQDEIKADVYKEKERKRKLQLVSVKQDVKKLRADDSTEETILSVDSAPASPCHSEASQDSGVNAQDETSNEGLVVDVDSPSQQQMYSLPFSSLLSGRQRPIRGSSKRGRPRGSRRGGLSRGRGISINLTNAELGLDMVPSSSSSTPQQHPMMPVRRGPGRPRLKPSGPSHQTIRGTSRPRKPLKPLPVPLRSSSAPSSVVTSSPSAQPFGFYTQSTTPGSTD